MHKLVTVLLIIVALIHLAPITGALGNERLSALYGLNISEPNITILMRHRAFLFGLLGAFILYAAFTPALQPLAFIGAAVSLATFIGLTLSVGDYNDALRKVLLIDVFASVCLFAAVVIYLLTKR